MQLISYNFYISHIINFGKKVVNRYIELLKNMTSFIDKKLVEHLEKNLIPAEYNLTIYSPFFQVKASFYLL